MYPLRRSVPVLPPLSETVRRMPKDDVRKVRRRGSQRKQLVAVQNLLRTKGDVEKIGSLVFQGKEKNSFLLDLQTFVQKLCKAMQAMQRRF